MALFFFVTLCVSVLGLMLLLSIKRYEMRTRRLFFALLRPFIDRVLHTLVFVSQYLLPYLLRRGVLMLWRRIRAGVSRAFARMALYVEFTLHRMLETLHKTTEPSRARGQVSAFLQEVADHKQKLLRKPAAKRAIFER
jgi:hypothetical protein